MSLTPQEFCRRDRLLCAFVPSSENRHRLGAESTQVPAITNSNLLPPLICAEAPNTLSLQKNTFKLRADQKQNPANPSNPEILSQNTANRSTIDRSLIDPDRPQTTDYQYQSTSDRFLKSEPFKPEIAKTPPRPTIHSPAYRLPHHLPWTLGFPRLTKISRAPAKNFASSTLNSQPILPSGLLLLFRQISKQCLRPNSQPKDHL